MKTSSDSAINKGFPYSRALAPLLILIFLGIYILFPEFQELLLGSVFGDTRDLLPVRSSLLQMTGEHLWMTALASLASISVGLGLGIVVTRKSGEAFLPLVKTLGAAVQTLPPSAVIILAFPFLGFGLEPTVLALFLYTLFPVTSNTILGIQNLGPGIREAAKGMGLGARHSLLWVELPLAMPVILTGIRYSVILNLGTAAIGAVIGAGGLGSIIISGLNATNPALVFSGAIVISGLAVSFDMIFGLFQSSDSTT